MSGSLQRRGTEDVRVQGSVTLRLQRLPGTAAALAAAVLLASCGGATRPAPVSPDAGPGPLAAMPPGGLCGESFPASLTVAFYEGQNATSSPLRVTGAELAGTRDVTVTGTWSDPLAPGEGGIGDWNGRPPPGWRHPVALTVPAGGSFEVMFTLALGHDPLVSGERVSYVWRGRSYEAGGQRYLGIPPGVHC
jgi:hypothetical protein